MTEIIAAVYSIFRPGGGFPDDGGSAGVQPVIVAAVVTPLFPLLVVVSPSQVPIGPSCGERQTVGIVPPQR